MWEKSKLKKLEIGQKWNFSCFFIFLWSNICVRGPNLFILVFFQLNLLSNVKYFMKKTFLNNHLFPLKDAVNLWNDFKTLYTVFFLFLREIYKKNLSNQACAYLNMSHFQWIMNFEPLPLTSAKPAYESKCLRKALSLINLVKKGLECPSMLLSWFFYLYHTWMMIHRKNFKDHCSIRPQVF